MTFNYVDEDHKYFLDDIRIPGVSNVLDLIAPYSEFITERYMNKGKYIHRCCEFSDRGTLDFKALKDDSRGYVIAWNQFIVDQIVAFDPGWFVKIEIPIFSKIFRYGATPDRIYITRAGGFIIDIKIGNHLFKRTELQLIAYRQACIEKYAGEFNNLWEVNLNANGTYKIHEYKYTKAKFNKFLCGLTSYNYRNL